jgi:hypothetical protein
MLTWSRFQPPLVVPPHTGGPLARDPCYQAPGPARPSNISCVGGVSSVRLQAIVDDATDAVSVELYSTKLGLTEKPNIHYVLATDGRRLVGSVPGLEAGAGYRAAVRAHRRGCAEDGANGTWSGLTWLDGVCTPLP